MIYKQIKLQITNKQLGNLKDQNKRIFQHLESRLQLDGRVLGELPVELSNIINGTAEFTDILKKINGSGDYYNVQLLHDDNEILNLPWLAAIDNVSGQPLGSIQQLVLSKCLPKFWRGDGKPEQSAIAPPLKILVMISSPEDSDPAKRLSYEEEEFQILRAFEPLLQTGQVEIDFTDDGSLEALERKIKRNKYHVLHYSGHGAYKDGKGYLILEHPLNLEKMPATAKEFADVLNCNPEYRIPLVVLSSCQTARGENERALQGVTNHLLQVGTPAVISMGMAIQDYYAAVFSAHFYGEMALKRNILTAFNAALKHMREEEYNNLVQAHVPNPRPLQWIIPNLYLSQNMEHLVNWESAQEKLELSSYRFIYENDRLLLRHDERYMFIGRRRDKAEVLPPFFEKKPVLLRGQGGVGKTAMAEHMIQRLIAANPNTMPFVFSEKTKSIMDIQEILKRFLYSKNGLDSKEFNLCKEGMEQLVCLVGQVGRVCRPVFIFDNLETFQTKPGEEFAPEYADIKEVIEYICRSGMYHAILTARYPLPEFDYVRDFNLNQVSFNDFWKKCQYLELNQIARVIVQKKTEERLKGIFEGGQVSFIDIVKLLHQTFGGNYRALEFFNELFKKNPDKLVDSLKTLDSFRKEYAAETNEVKMVMSTNLLFDRLLDLLPPGYRALLELLSHFRIPVRLFALDLQGINSPEIKDIPQMLGYLNDLTLLEISWDRETETIYYCCTPIVRDLLDKAELDIHTLAFSHRQAGIYHYDSFENYDASSTELEEAFFHFYKAGTKDKVQSIGEKLSRFYYGFSLYRNSFYYADQVYRLLGEETENSILNCLGLIWDWFGKYDESLFYYQKALAGNRKEGDKSGEGTTLNNISQIYDARGDYETALKYLEQSLKISQELGDKKGMSTTLHNMAMIADTKEDYERYIEYEMQAYQLAMETGDAEGLYHVGLQLGQILCAGDMKEEGIEMLKRSYEIGKQAKFPNIEEVEKILTELGEKI